MIHYQRVCVFGRRLFAVHSSSLVSSIIVTPLWSLISSYFFSRAAVQTESFPAPVFRILRHVDVKQLYCPPQKYHISEREHYCQCTTLSLCKLFPFFVLWRTGPIREQSRKQPKQFEREIIDLDVDGGCCRSYVASFTSASFVHCFIIFFTKEMF